MLASTSSTSTSAACSGSNRRCIASSRVSAPVVRVKRSIIRAAAQANEPQGLFSGFQKLAKRLQGSLPIVGLVSRLTSTEGGYDELAYPEFCRSVSDRDSSGQFQAAVSALGKAYGKFADVRWLFLLLWMAKTGSGLVPAKHVVDAARRLRVTCDMEIEIDRFDGVRDAVKEKYNMIAVPEPNPAVFVDTAVDAICTLCVGLKDGVPVPDKDVVALSAVVRGAYPEVSATLVDYSIKCRDKRGATYATAQA